MKKSLIMFSIFGVIFSGCAHRARIMNANAVSMTKESVPAGAKFTELGTVDEKFCPDMSKDSGTVGLLDEAVKAAQQKTGADFITSATFYVEGAGCVVVNGTAVKLK